MEVKKLDKRIRTIWILRNVFLSLLLVVGIVFACLEGEIELILGVTIPAGIMILLLLIWPFLSYKYYSYGYDDTRISINHGVIFRHRIIIPIRQIQDLHTYNGPVMNILKLSGIMISTAGSNFNISGMITEDAKVMVKELEERLNKRLDGEQNEEV